VARHKLRIVFIAIHTTIANSITWHSAIAVECAVAVLFVLTNHENVMLVSVPKSSGQLIRKPLAVNGRETGLQIVNVDPTQKPPPSRGIDIDP
jgi:hypothetical protein